MRSAHEYSEGSQEEAVDNQIGKYLVLFSWPSRRVLLRWPDLKCKRLNGRVNLSVGTEDGG